MTLSQPRKQRHSSTELAWLLRLAALEKEEDVMEMIDQTASMKLSGHVEQDVEMLSERMH